MSAEDDVDEDDYDEDYGDEEVEDEVSDDSNWQFSDAGKKMWQAISGISFGKFFRRKYSAKKSEAPEYWTQGSQSKVKDYMGWDL